MEKQTFLTFLLHLTYVDATCSRAAYSCVSKTD